MPEIQLLIMISIAQDSSPKCITSYGASDSAIKDTWQCHPTGAHAFIASQMQYALLQPHTESSALIGMLLVAAGRVCSSSLPSHTESSALRSMLLVVAGLELLGPDGVVLFVVPAHQLPV